MHHQSTQDLSVSVEPTQSGTALTPDDVTAVILAGGKGTRIREQLPDLPKPLAPIRLQEGDSVTEKPFLDWQLRYLAGQGIRRVVLSTGYLAEKVADYVNQTDLTPLSVCCVPEPEPLGTGGGFLQATQQCPSAWQSATKAWLVLNGDSLIVADYAPLWQSVDVSITGTILGVKVADASRFGTLRWDEQEMLTEFAEKQAGVGVINSGVYLFTTGVISSFPNQLPLSFEYDVFPALLQQGEKIKVIAVQAPFIDIGTPATLGQAARFIEQHFGEL